MAMIKHTSKLLNKEFEFEEIMSNQQMLLHVLDIDFNIKGIIQAYDSIAWLEHYQNKGKFFLVCPDTEENIELLKQDYIIYKKSNDTAMIINRVQYIEEEKQIWVEGATLNNLLNNRVINGTVTINNVESSIYNLIESNLRGLPLVMSESEGFIEVFETQFTGGYLFEAVETLCKTVGLGFKVIFDYKNKKMIFKIYKGKDLSYGNLENNPIKTFKSDFGTLENLIIIDDTSIFKNVAYVAGMGRNEQRVWRIVGNTATTSIDRRELWVDARDVQQEENETITSYYSRLDARGLEKINEHIHEQTFNGQVNPDGFGVDFYLGDIITCDSTKYGIRLNTRIMAYEEVKESNKHYLNLTLGEATVNKIRW